MRQILRMAALLSLVGYGAEAFGQEPGDVAAGRRLAQQWCSECHRIDAAQDRVRTDLDAPSFPDVARDPSTTPLSLRVFFRSSHEDMPDLHISASQADDLVAYILSLKQQ